MKRMAKRLLALVTTGIMMCSMIACGSEDVAGDSSSDKYAQNPEYTFYSTDEGYDAVNDPEAITYQEMRELYGPIPDWEGEFFVHGSVKSMEVEFWRTMEEGYNDFAEYVKSQGRNFSHEVSAAQTEEDTEGQLSVVRDQVRQGGNGICLSAITDINCLPGMEEAFAAGIPVYAVGSELPGCYGFVGSNGYTVGQVCAEYMAELLDYKGQIGIIVGLTSQTATINRTNGFVDWMEENAPDIEIVAQQNADWERTKAKDITETWLTQYPDMVGIYSNADCMTYGIAEAVAESDKTCGEDMFIVSIDGEGEMLELIRQGKVSGSCSLFSYYMGEVAYEVCLRNFLGQDLPRGIFTPIGMIDKDNVDLDAGEIIGWEYPEFE